MAKTLDPQHLREVFDKHLPYEIEMLRFSSAALPGESPSGLTNALIECFWLHARNLIEFLKDDYRLNFCAQPYPPFNGWTVTKRNKLLARINNQISHLIYDLRTDDPLGKLNGDDMMSCLSLIEAELLVFKANLLADYSPASWADPALGSLPLNPQLVATSSAPTSVIFTVTTDPPPAFKVP